MERKKRRFSAMSIDIPVGHVVQKLLSRVALYSEITLLPIHAVHVELPPVAA